MLIATLLLLVVASAIAAQQAAQPEANVPVNTYRGYAHADCTDAGAPLVRIVLPAGKVQIPTTVPASPPRPAVELIVQGALDDALSKPIPVQEPPTARTLSVSALSCPVVGSCSRARTGTLSLQRHSDDGALTGEFRMRWPDEAARQTDIIGRFTAAWIAGGRTCG